MIRGINNSGEPTIYWERQQGDLMCGLHAVNSMLQGPFYDEITLSQVALDLDKKEQAMLGGKPEKSNHLNDGGYFSLNVLIEAMNRHGGFELSSIQSQENKLLNPK